MTKASGGSDGDIPLSQWIPHAIDCVIGNYQSNSDSFVVGRDTAVSSDAYIIPALRIAASIAKQICRLEEESNDSRFTLHTPESILSSKIVVYLDSNGAEPKNNLLFGDRNGIDDNNHHDVSNLLVDDSNIGNGELKFTQRELQLDGGGIGNDNVLNVTGAQLLSTDAEQSDCTTHEENLRRIYSLGVLFYELFSGGEQPSPIDNEAPIEFESIYLPPFGEDVINPLPIGQEHDDEIHLADALTIIDNLEEEIDGPNQRKKIMKNGRHASATTERLKMKKIPGPLCNLIANMLDCIEGEISDCESYRSIADVLFDLQLMLDCPTIYLQDIDLGNLCHETLDFGDTIMFGRECELSELRNSYQRSLLSLGEKVAIISGTAGSGKSFLCQRFGEFVNTSGGIFLSAKFDQLKQARPMSTLASAFNDYCEVLTHSDDISREGGKLLASELRRRLRNDDIFYLTKIMPSLVNIFDHDTRSDHEEDNCIDAQQRLQFLFCQFVEALTQSSSAAVALHLDDVHNADDASIGVIRQLVLSFKSTGRLFFLLSSRESEKLDKILSHLNDFDVPNIQIKMDNLSEDAINKIMSELLHLSPRLTRPLSSIAHHKTQGNALFFSRWIMALSKESLLRPSLSRRRWVWDEEEIRREMKMPDDVAMFFRNSIYKLSKDVQHALCVMACFGATLDDALIRSLESALDLQLFTPLNVAVSEGLLDRIDDQYRFSHDCIQEAAYDIILQEDKCLFHFQHGLSLATFYLAEVSLGRENDNILFAAVNQLNLGGLKALQEFNESFTVSTLNLKAGKKAMQMSDFKTAYSFFDNGISFLRKKHWEEHYDLSMELFCLAAKCALANGDTVSLKLLSQQVTKNARNFHEKLSVLYYSICALTLSAKFIEGAGKIEVILSQLLGDALVEHSSTSELLGKVQQTNVMLEKYSINDLKSLKRMTDPIKNITMLFLARLHMCFFMIKPEKQPEVIMKMVQLTLSYGMCETTPLAFCLFGSLLGKLGYIEKGHQYTKLAKELVEEYTFFESCGYVVASANQLMCYVEPAQARVPLFIEGFERSMSAGDVTNACVSMLYYCNEGYISGLALPKLKEKCSEFREVMKQLGNVPCLIHLSIIERHLQSLMGVSWGCDHQADEEIEKADPHTVYFSLIYSLFNNFMFRRYSELESVLTRFLAHNRVDWTLMFGQSEGTFIFGLTLFWLCRVSKVQDWKHAGIQAKEAMLGWTKSSKWNFEHKYFLMEAEEMFCDKNYEQAKILYDKAINSAKEHRFLNGEALACELAGYFYLELDEKSAAKEYFAKALERYSSWGAHRKKEEVEAKLNSIS